MKEGTQDLPHVRIPHRLWQKQYRRSQTTSENSKGRGEYAHDPPSPEFTQRDDPAGCRFSMEVTGTEETGNDERHIDADESIAKMLSLKW
jgi:hypothetical protein